MEYLKIMGFAITGLVAVVLLKRVKEEYALFVSLLTGLALTLTAISLLEPVLEYIGVFADMPQTKSYASIIFKSAGIAIITTVASDLCKDCGESALGNKLELCGKALIVSMALPLIKTVFDSCLSLLE